MSEQSRAHIMCRLLLLITTLSASECYNILCLLPYHGKSHYIVFEPLLQELTRIGHNLTVVSFFPESEVQPNRRDVSLGHLAPLNVEVVNLDNFDYSYFGLERYFEHIPLVTALAKSNLKLCEKILDSDVFAEFLKREGNYDVILVEHFNSDCMLGIVHHYKLPSIGIMSSGMLPWTPSRVGAPDNPSYVPGLTLPFTAFMKFFERLENMIVLHFYTWWYEIVIRWEEQMILERKLGYKLPPLSEVGKNASAVLINTHYSWNGVWVMPPSVVEIGGLHLHNKSVALLPKNLQEWSDGAINGFMLFSFGSLIRGSTLPPRQLSAILKVFARLPQRVIWKWETEDIENLPPNVLIMKWLPQYDLLHHLNCVAFITHGGLLSLTEAVAAAVPTLVVPVLGDQFGNAAHALKTGIARVLRLSELNDESLHEELQIVLSEKMRQRAKTVSEVWWNRPQSPMDTAVFHIERAVRYKWMDLSSHARHLGWIERNLLDVWLFIVVLLAAISVIIKTLCRRPKTKYKQT